MNASHRRPLFAFVLVTVAGAVVVAQGMVAGVIPIPFFGLDLDLRAAQVVVSRGAALDASAVERRAAAEQGDARSALDGLVIADDSVDAGPAASTPPIFVVDPPVSAAPQPDTSGGISSDLVGGGSPAPGPGDGGQAGGAGDADDDPVFGGPPLATPGDGDGGSGGTDSANSSGGSDDGGGPADGPKPHDFDHDGHDNGNSGSHPYGPAQPPRGQGNNNGHGHGADKDKPAKDKPAKDRPAKPAKDAKNG
jgi:hypothetical protein